MPLSSSDNNKLHIIMCETKRNVIYYLHDIFLREVVFMAVEKLEMFVRNEIGKYSDNIAYMALGKARRLGFECSGDLFAKAYASYNEAIPQSVLFIIAANNLCAHFKDKYHIKFKEDIYYILRHTEIYRTEEPEHFQDTKRKVVQFFTDPGKEDQTAAFEYLDPYKPRERADIISKIVEQYFIMTSNHFYFDQMSLRLYNYLSESAAFDEDGKISPEIENLVEIIWMLGGKM